MGGEGARGVRGGRLREVVERVEEPRGCGVEVAVGGGRASGARWRGRGGGWGGRGGRRLAGVGAWRRGVSCELRAAREARERRDAVGEGGSGQRGDWAEGGGDSGAGILGIRGQLCSGQWAVDSGLSGAENGRLGRRLGWECCAVSERGRCPRNNLPPSLPPSLSRTGWIKSEARIIPLLLLRQLAQNTRISDARTQTLCGVVLP